MIREIGGYIELELKNGKQFYNDAIYINSARNGIRYAIKVYDIKEIYVPYYTCPVVWQAISEENCKIIPYKIDKNFMPIGNFDKDSFVLYTNYFGVCAKNIQLLSKKYKNLVVDNAMAFFMKHYGILSTYSPRKFFGVPDGGIVITNKKLDVDFEKDFSYNRFSHLIKRIEGGSNFGYEDFNKNDDSLINEPIKYMSNLTYKMLGNVNYKDVIKKRKNNYDFLNKHLSKLNLLNIKLTSLDVPMYYPFVSDNATKIRQKLIENKIYVPKCWRNLESNIDINDVEVELYYYENLIPLIIDQRYNKEDLQYMLNIIMDTK